MYGLRQCKIVVESSALDTVASRGKMERIGDVVSRDVASNYQTENRIPFSVRLSVCPSVRPSVCLSVCVNVCLER